MKKSRSHHMRKRYERRIQRRLEQAEAVRDRLGLNPKKKKKTRTAWPVGQRGATTDEIFMRLSVNLYSSAPSNFVTISGFSGV